MDRKRLKVLLSAYACEPGKGSEPGVGWNLALQVARYHDVTVITREDNRPHIEGELASRPVTNLQFVYFDFNRRGFGGSVLGTNARYYWWQLGAYRVARKLHQTKAFDLVHHVTYARYWSPSLMFRLRIPFVWGPVGGGESTPRALRRSLHISARSTELMRDVARWAGEHDPLVRATAKWAVVALATTEETADRLRVLGAKRVVVHPNVGLSDQECERLSSIDRSKESTIKFLSVGRLIHTKGFDIGLRAFAQARIPGAEYLIIGDGPERRYLESVARQLDVERQVRFLGARPRVEVLQHLTSAQALVHPSLHDSGGFVCAEAMAAGIPVICLDTGGPGYLVPCEAGIKVNATLESNTIELLADAMRIVANNPQLRETLGRHGRRYVRQNLTWEAHGCYLAELYQEVVSQSNGSS